MVDKKDLFGGTPNPFVTEFYRTHYVLLGRKEEDGLISVIHRSKDSDIQISPEQLQYLHDDVLRGLRLAQQIDSRSARAYGLKVKTRFAHFISVDGSIGPTFLQALPEARSAAVLHELMHDLEEECHLIWGDDFESLPMLAEFLFTRGSDRIAWMFATFEESFTDSREGHAEAWHVIRPLFERGDESGSYEDRFRAMLKKKKAMSEEEKIEMLKRAVAEARVIK